MDEREKILQRKQEDLRFVQGCVFVGIALLLELYLFQVRDYYILWQGTYEKAIFLQSTLEWGLTLSPFLAIGGFCWLVTSFVTGKGDIFYPIATFLTGLEIFFIFYGVHLYSSKGLGILLFLVPAWGGLALVFCLYQVEFFISAFFTSLGGIGLWLSGQTTLFSGGQIEEKQMAFYVFLNLAMITILLGFYCVNKAYQNEGVFTLGKQELTLISDLKDSSSLWLVGLSGVMPMVALAVAITFGFQVIYYCTLALLGWLFVLLVYYTVKMM